MSIQQMSVFHHIFFHKLLCYYFSMFQCSEHVEMNTCLCVLAYTWMTIMHMNANFILLTANLYMFRWNKMLNWRLSGCISVKKCFIQRMKSPEAQFRSARFQIKRSSVRASLRVICYITQYT